METSELDIYAVARFLVISTIILFGFSIENAALQNFGTGQLHLYLILSFLFILARKHSTFLILFILAPLLGLLTDLMMSAPLGLHMLIYAGAVWLGALQNHFFKSQSFAVFWLGYAILCSASHILSWFIFSLAAEHAVAFTPIFKNISINILVFPLIFTFFNGVYQVIKPRESIS